MQTATPKHKHDAPTHELETPASFARFLRVTPQAVRNWIHAGKIPTVVNAGRIVRFERAAALEALNAGGAR
jgi:predicted site-specific integrase-resolvase